MHSRAHTQLRENIAYVAKVEHLCSRDLEASEAAQINVNLKMRITKVISKILLLDMFDCMPE